RAAVRQVADAGWVCERRRRRWRVLCGVLSWLRGARGASLAGRGGRRAVAGGGATRATGALGSRCPVRLVSRTGTTAVAGALVTQSLAEAGQVRQPGGDLRPLALDVSVRGLAAPRTPLALVGTSTGHGATVRRTATLVVPVGSVPGAAGRCGVSSMGPGAARAAGSGRAPAVCPRPAPAHRLLTAAPPLATGKAPSMTSTAPIRRIALLTAGGFAPCLSAA